MRERESKSESIFIASAQRKDQNNFVQNLFKLYFKKPQQSISSNKISFFYSY